MVDEELIDPLEDSIEVPGGPPPVWSLLPAKVVATDAAIEVLCDRHATDDHGALYVFSVVCHQSAMKAIHALLAGSKKGKAVDITLRSSLLKEVSAHRMLGGYTRLPDRLGYGRWHALFVSKTPGLILDVTDASLWHALKSDRFTTPLLKEWVPYLRRRLAADHLLTPLNGWQCSPAILTAKTDDLDKLVTEGIRAGEISLPVKGEDPGTGLTGCSGLDDFFTRYGPVIGRQVTDRLDPLYRPGVDKPLISCAPFRSGGPFLRPLLPRQADVAGATAKVLDRQRFSLIVGELGTGKTTVGAAAAHTHARGKPYRALVVCPDHLTDKWARELRAVVPGARVRRLRSWKEVLSLAPGTEAFVPSRWPDPEGPEWFIIGRDRAKLGPGWKPCYSLRRMTRDTRKVVFSKSKKADVQAGWGPGELLVCCPECGAPVLDKDGVPVPPGMLPKSKGLLKCKAVRARLTGDGDDKPEEKEVVCGAPLFQYTPKPRRAAPEGIINKRLRNYFDYLICDEVHEYKSEKTAQATAISAIAAASKNVIALTGTLIGGYANHLFPLLMRLAPATLRAEGLSWGESMEFSRRYGRVDRTVTKKEGKGGGASNKQSRGGGKVEVKERPAPGIMPPLYGRHLLDKSVFMSLCELSSNLPPLDERVIPVGLDDETREAYRTMEGQLKDAVASMVAMGDMRLLGAYLEALLYYPDHPYGWGEIGYTDKEAGYIPVSLPRALCDSRVRPKEFAIREFCRAERDSGNQVWLYVQRTKCRDMIGRLARVLGDDGLRVGALRSSVPRERREEWIKKQGRSVDVMISHPQLVETGLDLFSKERGGHNYSTIAFYQAGYRTFTTRQASRRTWRLGQTRPCKVRYFFYSDTMQEAAMALMGLKLKASLAIEGTFSEEGLAAMNAGGGSDAMALARMLAKTVRGSDVEAAWAAAGAGYGVGPGTEAAGLAWHETPLADPAGPEPAGPVQQLAWAFADLTTAGRRRRR